MRGVSGDFYAIELQLSAKKISSRACTPGKTRAVFDLSKLRRNENLATDSCGWANQFPVFRAASLEEIVNVLTNFVRDSTPEQIRAWRGSIRPLQQQCGVVLDQRPTA